jgi:hypothetical protein
VKSLWSSSSPAIVANITWTNRIFVTPGNYSIGNGTDAASYEINHTIPVGNYTTFGFHLFVDGPLWTFGDVVWKDTEVWVTDVKNHDWCFK